MSPSRMRIANPFRILVQAGSSLLLFATGLHAAPANDNAASATLLLEPSGVVDATLSDSTIEPNEARPNLEVGTVWYSYTAPKSGYLFLTRDRFTDSATPVHFAPFQQIQEDPPLYEIHPVIPFESGDSPEPHDTFAVPVLAQTNQLLRFGASSNAADGFSFDYHLITGGGFHVIDLPSSGLLRETQGTITITVGRDGGTDETATVDYAIVDVTTTAGSDYTSNAPFTGTLTFGPGVTRQTITINLVDDTDPEDTESFKVNLSKASANSAVFSKSTTLTVDDNDGKAPNDDFANRQTVTGNVSSTNLPALPATREPGEPAGFARTIWYSWTPTAAGVATLAATNANGPAFKVALFTGTTLATLEQMRPVDTTSGGIDPAGKPTASFIVKANTNYQIAIRDYAPDNQPSQLAYTLLTTSASIFRFAAPRQSALENAGSVTVQVIRLGPSTGTATVEFATPTVLNDPNFPPNPEDTTTEAKPGPPVIEGADYQPNFGTLQFASGETTKNITISVYSDAVTETPEYFRIALRNPATNSLLDYPSSIAVDLQDGKKLTPITFTPSTGVALLVPSQGTAGQGFINLKLMSNGRFTGFVVAEGRRRPVMGKLPPLSALRPGAASEKTVSVGSLRAPMNVTVHYEVDNELQGKVTGLVSNGKFNSRYITRAPVLANAVNRVPVRGTYNVSLTPDNNVPAAFAAPGFLNLTVSDEGTVKAVGRLPDGAAFVSKNFVTLNPQSGAYEAIVASTLYQGRGQISGALRLIIPGVAVNIPAAGDGDGALAWYHPKQPNQGIASPFTGFLSSYASLFAPVDGYVLKGTPPHTLRMTFSAPSIPATNFLFTVGARSEVTLLPGAPFGTKLKISSKDGVFSGTTTPFGALKPVKFQGVILPNATFGKGFFILPSETGTINVAEP